MTTGSRRAQAEPTGARRPPSSRAAMSCEALWRHANLLPTRRDRRGEFLDTVCGIPGSSIEIVMLKPLNDGTRLGISSVVRPDSVPGSPAAKANDLGLRNVALVVKGLQMSGAAPRMPRSARRCR